MRYPRSVEEPYIKFSREDSANLFTLQNQFITPRVFAPISGLQRNKPGTNRRCINARRKSATAKFKALGEYLCIDKSTPAEWRTEFGGEMVLARFLREAERRKRREKASRTGNGARKSVRESRGKVFANDENFTNWILMRHDGSAITKVAAHQLTNQRFSF